MLKCNSHCRSAAATTLHVACAVSTMGDSYSENSGYWANADSKQSTSAANKQTLESTEAQSEVLLDQNSIEPIRLTFSPPAAAQRHSLDQLTMHYAGPIPGPGQHPHDNREAVVEVSAADATPTASMLEGVQTPDLPEQHTGSVGARSLHTAPAVLQASPWLFPQLHAEYKLYVDVNQGPPPSSPLTPSALSSQSSNQQMLSAGYSSLHGSPRLKQI